MEGMKFCIRCKVDQPVTEYYKLRSSKDGLQTYCKTCIKTEVAVYRENNKDKIAATAKKYRESHKEEVRENMRQWYKENPDYSRRQYQKHIDKRRLRAKEYREKHPEKLKATRERRKDKSRDTQLKLYFGISSSDYDKILESQGGGCAICGATRSRNGNRLSVDHCHDTGAIRGIICDWCNRALGLLGDDLRGAENAFRYLLEFQEKELTSGNKGTFRPSKNG